MSVVICPRCAHRASPGDAFCAKCGTTLDPDDTVHLPAPDETMMAPANPEAIGGRYRVVGELGRGSFGAVYEAVDEKTDRRVAVKLLATVERASPDERAQVLRWFQREGKALSWLDHPGIVAFQEMGVQGELPFLVMELVSGGTLAEELEEGLTLRRAVEILKQLLDALLHAHQAGVVHRDLKPANVLLTHEGRAKVTDFGLAKISTSIAASMGTQGVFGTPNYMSPEQAAGRAVDLRSDIYSLGAIAFEMFTGRKAYDGNVTSMLYRIIYEAAPLPSSIRSELPASLDRFVARAMEKNPELRFASAAEMAKALSELEDELPLEVTSELPVLSSHGLPETRAVSVPREIEREEPSRPAAGERGLVLGALGLMVLLAALVGGISLFGVPDWFAQGPGSKSWEDRRLLILAEADAELFLDGLPVEREGPLPRPGRHIVSLLAPDRRPVRKAIFVPPRGGDVSLSFEAAMGSPGLAVERVGVVGTVVVGREPLALIRTAADAAPLWMSPGEGRGHWQIAEVGAEAVTFSFPLDEPPGETGTLRVDLEPPTAPARPVWVTTDPPGAALSLDGQPLSGRTPIQLELTQSGELTFERDAARVSLSFDVQRLWHMGELRLRLDSVR